VRGLAQSAPRRISTITPATGLSIIFFAEVTMMLEMTAYRAADPVLRDALGRAADTLNAMQKETRDAIIRHLAAPDAQALPQRAVTSLEPLLACTATIITGSATGNRGAQAAIDAPLEP
jgi:hypothetical protein